MRTIRSGVACLLALLMLLNAAHAKNLESLCRDIDLSGTDVQAWLEIPDTNISHPVMQHSQNDAYYLDHDPYGNPDNYGALFTESTYNSFDFSDPVIVIYGHRMNNGTMFGSLQKYYSGNFDAYSTINLYLPDGEMRQYTVFAAVIQDDAHILHHHNFHSDRVFRRYFDGIFATRRLGIVLDAQQRPQPGDQVIILSTCIKGDSSQRYLVMAKSIKEENRKG